MKRRNEQVRPASWFVKLTRVRDWPEGSATGAHRGQDRQVGRLRANYILHVLLQLRCFSFGNQAVDRWQLPLRYPRTTTPSGGRPKAMRQVALAGARREGPETISGYEAFIFWALDRSRRIWLQRLRGETQITKAGPEIRELVILAATPFGRLVRSDTNTNFPRKKQRKLEHP